MTTPVNGIRYGYPAFVAPLNASGLFDSSLPIPTVTWVGDDPTGSFGLTSHAFTATGSPGSIETPFCPAGNFAAIDSGGCSTAYSSPSGANRYDSDTAQIADPDSGDFTVCAVARRVDTASVSMAGTADSVSSDGWLIGITSSTGDRCWFRVEGSGGTASSVSNASVSPFGWVTCCGTADASGNVQPYVNGVADGTPLAYPGTVSSDDDMHVGWGGGTSNHMHGDIVRVDYWDSLLTASQLQDYAAAIQGVQDLRGAASTCTSTGPIGAWVGGQIEQYSDDWCPVGPEIAPGATGAGSGGCMLSSQEYTNDVLSSRDLSTNWTATGTSVVACSQSETPFRDGRTTCKATDDDGAGLEYISQVVSWSGANTSDPLAICLYAYADSAQTLDIQVDEATGAGCATSTADFTAASIGASWSQYEWIHTVADGDCTDFTLDVYPTDAASSAATGHAYVVAQVFTGVDHCPSIYCETTSAAVTCGTPSVAYDPSNIVDGSGDFVGTYRIVTDWMPSQDHVDSFDYVWFFHDGSTSNRVQLYHTTSEDPRVFSSAASVSNTILDGPTFTFIPGQRYRYDVRIDYDADRYELRQDGVSMVTSTTDYDTPTGIDTLQVAGSHLADQQSSPTSICNLRVYR